MDGTYKLQLRTSKTFKMPQNKKIKNNNNTETSPRNDQIPA